MANNKRREWIEERTTLLQGSSEEDELEVAATELASADDPDALTALGTFLRQKEFLDRLDPALEDRPGGTAHLYRVLKPLTDRPSPEAVRLCLTLVDEPLYAENDRKSFLLEAMAKASPMSGETAAAFRRSNDEGYFGFNALLLAANSSPLALELFAVMMADREVDEEARVELLHKGIVPHRTRLPILQMVGRFIAQDPEEPIAVAAIEAAFDYRQQWFKIHAPMAPAWRIASNDVLRFVAELGAQAKRRPNLPAELQAAIDDTVEIVGALLAGRGA
jgi:hypothetical protein